MKRLGEVRKPKRDFEITTLPSDDAANGTALLSPHASRMAGSFRFLPASIMPIAAHAKRPFRIGGWITFAALSLAGCSNDAPVLDAGLPTSVVILDERAAASEISRYRAQHGLGPVIVDPQLVKAASFQAASNARAGRLSHDIGGSFETRMASAGFGKTYAAENLSAGSDTFDQVLGRWKASSEHNKNMLIPQLRRIGIARVDAPETRFRRYWALVLAGD